MKKFKAFIKEHQVVVITAIIGVSTLVIIGAVYKQKITTFVPTSGPMTDEDWDQILALAKQQDAIVKAAHARIAETV